MPSIPQECLRPNNNTKWLAGNIALVQSISVITHEKGFKIDSVKLSSSSTEDKVDQRHVFSQQKTC